MRVLGISDHITAGAAVVEDGRVVAAVNEERLVRRKMCMGFPRASIRAVLQLTGLEPGQFDAIAVGSKTGEFLDEYVDVDGGVFSLDEGAIKNLFFSMGARTGFLRNRLPFLEEIYYGLKQPLFARRRRRVQQVMSEEFGFHCPIEFISHHHAHAASAYYASGYRDALLVTLDGAGDGHSSHVYEVRDGAWKLLHAVAAFDSLGCFYAYATELCGFKAGKHEGKLTGLSAHGKPAYRQLFERNIQYHDGTMTNLTGLFRESAIRKLRNELPADFRREDLAASIQELSEDISVRYVTHWLRKTGLSNVGLAGGVFANVLINQRVYEIDGVASVFPYPAMSDEGIAAGSALIRWHEKAPQAERGVARAFDTVYLGPAFSEPEIASALDAKGVAYTRPDQLELEVARLLSESYVVARFEGRMEYGPRALGNRSILYRPDDPSVNHWLNQRLNRTEFMPFAPATIMEDAERCYLDVDGAKDAARFMTITLDCTEAMKRSCAGVVHVDGTARPQLVREVDNPGYYRIIQEFKRLTGLPAIVNTSFNLHEEPIVCTPEDAIRAFLIGHLDVLAIGPFLAMNPKLVKPSERVREPGTRPPYSAS
jgi:carbamoyltransferase